MCSAPNLIPDSYLGALSLDANKKGSDRRAATQELLMSERNYQHHDDYISSLAAVLSVKHILPLSQSCSRLQALKMTVQVTRTQYQSSMPITQVHLYPGQGPHVATGPHVSLMLTARHLASMLRPPKRRLQVLAGGSEECLQGTRSA